MTEWFAAIVSGEAGVWFRYVSLIGLFLLGFWQALPKVLDAFVNKQAGIEDRMAKLLSDQTDRFNAQLAAADQRHDDCMEGQRRIERNMLARIERLEAENADLRGVIAAMRQGEQSMQNVVVRAIKEAGNDDRQ